MTDPQDFYPWPPKSSPSLSHPDFLSLINHPGGRESLQEGLTIGLKQYLRRNPLFRQRDLDPTRDDLVLDKSDQNAQAILKIYDFLCAESPPFTDPTGQRDNLYIYFEALRSAHIQLMKEDHTND